MEDFEKLLEQNPQLGLSYTKWIGFRFKRLQNRYTNLMFKDVRTRFMSFMNEWASKEGTQQMKISFFIIILHIKT
jgi:CRP/FNR family transcriptional regulator